MCHEKLFMRRPLNTSATSAEEDEMADKLRITKVSSNHEAWAGGVY